MAGRVFQALGNLVPGLGLVGVGYASLLCLQAEGHAVINDIGHGCSFFSDQLRQGLARVLVVQRHLYTRAGGDSF